MADTDPTLIGVEACGCVTYANARPEWVDREDVKAMNRIRKSGGRTVMTTLAKAKAHPNFLPAECPHDPPGWKREFRS